MVAISEKEYKQLAYFVKKYYGINLGDKKQTLVEGRLQNILIEKGFKSFSQYYKYVLDDKTGEALTMLINKITTNHTFFMREVDHFHYFRDKVMNYVVSNAKNNDIRIWSAGSSTGQEAYTLAMIINDYFGNNKSLWDAKVLATDISSEVLNIAIKGKYNNRELETIPNSWRMNYFRRLDDQNSVLIDEIKNEVIYRKFNLMDEVFPFKKKFHVIFCRNVMIYFDNETRNKLINKFVNCLEDGGYLFIGHSESLNQTQSKLKYIMPAVYRKE